MTSVLLLSTPDPGAPDLASDFARAGFHVCGTGECAHLVRETLRAAPDVLVCWAPRPGGELLPAVATLLAQQPLPVLVFTLDSAAEGMERALQAGVHAWVVQGYAPERLRPLVHLAQARERHERTQRERVAELAEKLEERKWVDRAKGVLMHAAGVGEEEAFRLLRNASMHGNQRVGQLSRQVIDAAKVAEALNRAGQQRMLSQRLVKLYALACSRTDGAAAALLMKESIQRVEDNLGVLEAQLSLATYGDLIAAARAGWQDLRRLLEAPPQAEGLAAVDRQADAVLLQADALVRALEGSGLAPQVHVVNVCGRQRMLSQRMAKLAVLGGPREALADTAAEFERSLDVLQAAPLSTPAIREGLQRGAEAWRALRESVTDAAGPAGRMRVAAASEELLEIFDRLTEAYQRSVRVLLGGGAPAAS